MTEEISIESMPPGILVASKIEMRGGIHYERDDVDEYFEDNFRKIRKWNTKSVVDNVEERSEAIRTVSTMRYMISSLCTTTKIGLICPESKVEELHKAIATVRQMKHEFNSKAKTCEVSPHIALFDVKEDNEDAIAAIADQVAEVCTRVDGALTMSDLDALRKTPKKFLKGVRPEAVMELTDEKREAFVARARAEIIRSALATAKGLDRLLPKAAGDEIKETVKRSRRIARALCNRVEKKNEDLQEVLNEVDLSGIRRTRTAFIKAAAIAVERAEEKASVRVYAPVRKLER